MELSLPPLPTLHVPREQSSSRSHRTWKQPEPTPDSSSCSHTCPFYTGLCPREASAPCDPGSKESSSDHSCSQCFQEGGGGRLCKPACSGQQCPRSGGQAAQVSCTVHRRASQALNWWKRTLLGPSGAGSPAGMSRNPFQGAVFSVQSLTSTALSSITWPLGQSAAAL